MHTCINTGVCIQAEIYTHKRTNTHTHTGAKILSHVCTAHTTHTLTHTDTVCEWVLAQVCLWEEITVLGGEVFQQPAASSLPLCGHWLYPWRAQLAFYHTKHMCVFVCVCLCTAMHSHVYVLLCAFAGFISCLTTDWQHLCVHLCVSVSVCLHCVPLCVFSLRLVWLLTC